MKKSTKILIISVVALLLIIGLIIGIILVNRAKNNELDTNADSWYQGIDSNHAIYSGNSKNGYMDNRVIILFHANATDKEKQKAVDSINGKIIGENEDGDKYQVELSKSYSSEELDNICTRLNQLPGVFFSFPELIVEITSNRINIPNDPWKDKIQGIWDQTWNEEKAGGLNWWLEVVKAPSAWDYNDRFSNIKIGVVDDGFDTEHEDLEIEVLNSEVNSKEDHGTHVAGIIGATANNEKGITGIVWNKTLYGVDVSATKEQENTGISILNDFEGIEKAIEYGCKVVNLSRGAKELLDEEDIKKHGSIAAQWILYWERKFNRKDFIIVQSAGNDNCNSVKNGLFCSITDDTIETMFENIEKEQDEDVRQLYNKDDIYNHIMIVGAIAKNTKNYKLYNGFCYGEQISVVAPGEEVFSTIVTGGIDGSYGDFGMTGTSMATPIVTGVASLVWSVNPDFTAGEVKDIVCNYTDKTAKGYAKDDNRDYPIVNAKLAVEEAIRRTELTTSHDSNKNNLAANDSDFEEFSTLFEKISVAEPLFEYSSSDSSAYQTLLVQFLAAPTEITALYYYFYDFYEHHVDIVTASNGQFKDSPGSQLDPLNKFAEFHMYGKVKADEIDWIIKNVFGVTPNRDNATIIMENECHVYYYENYYYFMAYEGGFIGGSYEIKNKEVDSNNVYTIEIDYSIGGYDPEYEGTYKIICALKNIDGKRQWTFSSIEKIEKEESNTQSTTASTNKKETTTKKTTTTKPKVDYSIKSVYKEILKDNQDFDPYTYSSLGIRFYKNYTVYDINKDGTPELIIRNGFYEADFMFKYYTYKDGKAIYLGATSGGHSGLYGIDDKNGIYRRYGHMGFEEIYLVEIKNNNITEKSISSQSIDFENGGNYTQLDNYLEEVDTINYSLLDNLTT